MRDVPDQLTVGVGEQALVRLPSLAAAGYTWEATAEDPRIVETSITFEEASSASADSVPAFGISELLVIRGRTPGSSQVRCRQRRTWEPADSSVDHTVAVEVVPAAGSQPTTKGKP